MNDDGYKASGLVKVITELAPPIAVHDITEAPIMLSLNLGESFLRAGSVEPVRATEQGVSWFSNNPIDAAVNASTGQITITGFGEIDIAVKRNDGVYQASVIVEVAPTQKVISMHPMSSNGVLNVDLSTYKSKQVEIKRYDQNNRMLEVFRIDENQDDIN